MISIRRAVPDDAEAMERVLRESFAEYESLYTAGGLAATTPTREALRERLSEGPGWVAVQDEAVVGTVSAVPKGGGVYIRSMAVLPAARGQRVGALLLAEVESWARSNGANYLFLSTTPFLARAIRLYEHAGFTRTADGPHELFGTPLFTMVKHLKEYVVDIASEGATLARAGGKAANLSELARAGFPVPSGFIVTTDAYRAFVEANQLQARILELAGNVPSEDPRAREAASADIRALFAQGAMPEEIGEAVRSSYRKFSGEGVAVRSSATAEDLPGMAFAGQQDTYLNVVGENEVLDAVKECWASLWTARAMAYRARGSIPSEEVALAVVVQQMVASESSGVLFTANPLTGRRDQMVIDASFGLGEAIVSGQVEPDHYVVETESWRITERKLGAKELAIVPQAAGGTARVERPRVPAASAQALPDAQIVELARLADRVARLFQAPQDIEWALAGGELYLLQSRPITSLYPLPVNPRTGLRAYFNLNTLQGVADPISPLGRDVLRLLLRGVGPALGLPIDVRQYALAAGGRIFIDVTDPSGDPRLRHLVLGVLIRADPPAHDALDRLLRENRIPQKTVLTRRRLVSILLHARPVFGRLFAALLSPERARARVYADFDQWVAQSRQRVESAPDLATLTRALNADIGGLMARALFSFVPLFGPAFGLIAQADRMLVEWLGERPGAALALLRGLEGNVTTEMDLQLWAAAREIRGEPAAAQAIREQPVEQLAGAFERGELPPVAQHALGRFLDRYGMRAVAEIDIYRPRWRDDPSPLLQTLKSYLELKDPRLAPDAVFEQNRAEAERLAAEYRARLAKTRFGFLRARLFGAAVRRMRALAGAREAPKFLMVRTFDAYRTALLKYGRELGKRGTLDRADDIFFIPLEMLEAVARGERPDLKARVAAGRAEYEMECRRRQMPRLLLSTGEAFYEGLSSAELGADALAGDPVSPGVAEGPVHVVLDPHSVRLEPGEILVCPATDPGWTPLFLTAGGLVMEMGGMMTHGSVVAREYGIPAVVGVHNATTRLKNGERVRVDGNRGQVQRLDGEK